MFEANTIEHHMNIVHHAAAQGGPDEDPKERLFLHAVPRKVDADFGAVLNLRGEIAPHFHFTVYPTLILSWTALGLFFGAFLEGFVRGERLRRESSKTG